MASAVLQARLYRELDRVQDSSDEEEAGTVWRTLLVWLARGDACVWAACAMDTAAWVLFPWSPAEDRAGSAT